MEINLADVVIHIDETLEAARRQEIENMLREIDGVVSVRNPDDRPHLTLVEYNPARTDSQALLTTVTAAGVHAELIGL
ncbi:MAG: ATP-binding protein [Thiohalocapsa sp. PB-PSB1]|nr:MAG: hypothetical protein N838_30300 [Thiohalocapsa sp. PB-PSB1]QQO55122.1 MAG: ATP-binding protein [Thiohalocapsa sp. PB-PSB1]